ncbi:MAG TPA: UDP-N-acetylmuramoyl-L-alanyl-D-glutamate--2,6-diaminopimelate ligase [Verrucomicrobiales bacterium]|nr:UDP-N-acetylmuramoyl-L-alanyl-D-glutamate--2,6-diaminopimelate ligase [Verrucomicrobiales bacterium]
MKLRDIVARLEQPVVSGSLDTDIRALAYDSRKVGPGAAFFALRGAQADGHDFIQAAMTAGAAAIIAETAPPADAVIPWVHARSTRRALAAAAAALHDDPGRVLALAGITGTNGKTTTAFLLHDLLNQGQKRAGLIGTVSWDTGARKPKPATHTTPESLEIQGLLSEMRDNGCRTCVMEVSSHALDQERVHGLDFAAGIFTNLTQDHLDYHGTMEKYFAAKARLFEKIAAQKTGRMVVNGDDAWGRKLITRFEGTGKVVRYGFGAGLEFRATNVRYDVTGTTYELEALGRHLLVRLPLIGDFNVYNSLAALAGAHAMGLNLRESVAHLKSAPQVPGRLERVTDQTRFHVYVDYAHTPDAIENALRTLRALRPRRIITVFGCGGDRDRTKRPKMAAAAEAGSDVCVLTSDNPRFEDPEAIIADTIKGFARPKNHAAIADRRQAIRAALEHAQGGDIVLVAGKGHEDYQDIQGKKHPFDDRRVVRQTLNDLFHERDAEAAEREALREQEMRDQDMRGPWRD